VLELCQRGLDEFRSRKVVQFQESLVRAVRLESLGHGRTYTFVNTGDNLWSPEGEALRAPNDFVQSLDGLLNLAAKRWLDDSGEAKEVLKVTLLPQQGEPFEFSLLQGPEASVLCRTASGLVAEADGALLARLLRLF
jgi:hypothetical protein